MFQDSVLKEMLEKNSSIESTPVVLAEFNQNHFDNVYAVGCYKNAAGFPLPTRWNETDSRILEAKFYASDSLFDEISPEGYEFEYNEQKKLDQYFSLIDCLKPNRPRSGINKILYRPGKYVDDLWTAERPRYYLASPDDSFKYWTSYRNYGSGLETGVSNAAGYINDAAPFVIYSKAVPANRIVVKFQTNYGASIPWTSGRFDPLTNRANSSIPQMWRIQYLNEKDEWVTAYSFPESSLNDFIGSDGHVEISYGVIAPKEYDVVFGLIDYVETVAALPVDGFIGEAYIVGATESSVGRLYVWSGSKWTNHPVEFGFKNHIAADDFSNVVRRAVNPRGTYINKELVYHEFVMVRGMRIVVDQMLNANKTFDLIEMSPRLLVSMADYTESYDVEKVASFEDEAFPVGGLAASTGSINLFNGDGMFTNTNVLSGTTGSIFAGNLYPGTKFTFWELYNVDGIGAGVPIKTLYVEDWPEALTPNEPVSVQLRDAFFLLEKEQSPDVLRRNMSTTGAISWLLDNAGYSNYVFRGFQNNDPIIPYFFTNSEMNIAEALNEISKATQTMMYFDEYNNFVVASKAYLFDNTVTPVFKITGSDILESGTLKNLANIEKLDSKTKQFFNAGTITYTDRYIQRSPQTLAQSNVHDRFRQYIYKPVLLWEVSASDNTKTINEALSQQQGYALTAMALRSNLSAAVPSVSNGSIINNVIDVGENAYWVARYDGYLYANGEIIRYDAVEFAVPGQSPSRVWIRDNTEYQYYFSRIPFNGYMYPTGRLRIYAEPYMNGDLYINGKVREHGRGQFNTTIAAHHAGLSSYWTSPTNTETIEMSSSFIFNQYQYDAHQYTSFTPNFGVVIGAVPSGWILGSTIKNMWSEWYKNEDDSGDMDPGAIQASALCLNGPIQHPKPLRDTVTISSKSMSGATFVGSRLRIIGREENGLDGKTATTLSPFSFEFKPQQGSDAFLSGGSAGICAFYNKTLKTGYFFELISFSSDTNQMTIDGNEFDLYVGSITINSGATTGIIISADIDKMEPGFIVEAEGVPAGTTLVSRNGNNVVLSNAATATIADKAVTVKKYAELQAKGVHTVIFYKVVPGTVNGVPALVPVKLWGSLAQVLIDQGIFVGQSRSGTDSPPTVYDIGIEYLGTSTKYPTFNLYINGTLVGIVEDTDVPGVPGRQLGDANTIIQNGTHCGMFVRGSTNAMFENIITLKNNSINSTASVGESIWGDALNNPSDRKILNYQISPFLKAAMSGVATQTYGQYTVDYEEFGTILRECAHFNVRYDQAYPAFYSKLAPNINNSPVYIASNYLSTPYSAQFMIFNITDKAVKLDETTGNYLRILGVTFTQSTSRPFTVDEYISKSARNNTKLTNELAASRREYGEKAFSFENMYIQTQDSAQALMEWLLGKIRKPRMAMEITIFPTPTLQLGDIIVASYKDKTGTYISDSKQLIINGISYSRSEEGPEMKLKVVER